jgi:hypothetical protein
MPSPNQNSLRLQILKAVQASFASMTVDAPTDDPYGIVFSTVALGKLAETDQRKRYSLGVVAGPEKEEFGVQYVMKWLQVNIEFRVTVNRDDPDPGEMIEQCLTVVQRRVMEDRQWGGLAIDTKTQGSEVDLVTYWDRSAVGVCYVIIQYRTAQNDPRQPNLQFGNK